MLIATRVFAIVFMALVFRGFIRTKLYPVLPFRKLIFAECVIHSSENPENALQEITQNPYVLIFCGDP
jgi:hypothetical protein